MAYKHQFDEWYGWENRHNPVFPTTWQKVREHSAPLIALAFLERSPHLFSPTLTDMQALSLEGRVG